MIQRLTNIGFALVSVHNSGYFHIQMSSCNVSRQNDPNNIPKSCCCCTLFFFCLRCLRLTILKCFLLLQFSSLLRYDIKSLFFLLSQPFFLLLLAKNVLSKKKTISISDLILKKYIKIMRHEKIIIKIIKKLYYIQLSMI